MPMTRAQLYAMSKKLEGATRKAFERVIQAAKSRAELQLLAQAVESGDIGRIMTAAGTREGMWSPLTEQIRVNYGYAGAATMASDLPKKLKHLDFDINNPSAEEWLKKNAAAKAVELKASQQAAIQKYLEGGMRRGDNPLTVARDIAGRVGPNGRRAGGVLGLTDTQAGYVDNMRDDLLNLDRRYFTRKLRDRRYDKYVQEAIDAGKPLSRALREEIAGRYEDRLLKHRADTIARTEAMNAISAASNEAMKQVVEQGLAPEHAIKRIWRHSFAKNERPGHLAMGREPQVRGLNEPFENPVTGAQLMRPHLGEASEVINCRCYVQNKIDFAAVERERLARAAGGPVSFENMGPSEFNTYGGRFSLASQVNPDIARQLAARPKKVRPPKPTTVPASEYVGDVVPIDVDAALTHVEQFAPEFKLLRSFIVKNQAGSVFMHPEISAEVFAKKKFGRQLRVYNKSLGGKMMRGAEKVWYDAWEANGWATRATKYVNVFVSEKNRGASFMKKWDFEDLRKGVRHHMELAGKVPQRIYSVSTIGSWATEFNQAKTFCTWTHEMSHRVFFKLFMSNGAKPSRLYQQAARVAEKYKGRGITTYSDTNVDEFYAEHIAAWLIDRKGMEKAFPEIADIVKDIMAWAK